MFLGIRAAALVCVTVLAACAAPRPIAGPSVVPPSMPSSVSPTGPTLGMSLGPSLMPVATSTPDPASFAAEGASRSTVKAGWSFTRQAVAAAHPLAADAGLAMLRAGGHAIDAAVAVQAVLTLVEPQSSGIGGGALLLHWDGRSVQAWDGRETAPAAAGPLDFLRPDGTPVPSAEAIFGGRAVGVPGVLPMLQAAHREYGVLPWAQLFEPAVRLAEQGFPLGERLYTLLQSNSQLRQDPQARAYFYAADGRPHPVGHLLRNPALAVVLRAVAAQGAVALQQGPVADDLIARVRSHAVPGAMVAADLASYRAVRREAICTDWRERWRICGFPPPSSGHLALMQVLGLLDTVPASVPGAPLAVAALAAAVPAGPPALHLYVEASRLAWADRAQYVADPDFVPAPAGDWRSLLQPDYLRQRAALIGSARMANAPAGQPGGPQDPTLAFAPMPEQPEQGTSHISIVDSHGNALALTSSVEAAFGARVMADGASRTVAGRRDGGSPGKGMGLSLGLGLAGGYILNNQLTDFSLSPTDTHGRLVANRLQPGKRPRSSMSPTLVFDRGRDELVMVLGSPGGPLIPHFVARTLLATLVGGQDLQRAIDGAHVAVAGGPVLLEKGRFPTATGAALRALGHEVLEVELPSGLHGLQRTPTGWFGAADPRREGVVRGD